MKNKFLSCLLTVAMIATLFVVPVSASSANDITVDLSTITAKSGDTVTYANGTLNLPAGGDWAEFTVTVAKTGTYLVKLTRPSTNRTEVTVNGETINWRGGRVDDTVNGVYTLLNEAYLTEGENTVRVAAMAGKVGSITGLTFAKTSVETQLLQVRGVMPKAASIDDLNKVADPQANALVASTEEPLWVTYEFTVPETGVYYPAIAQVGPQLEVTFGDKVLDMSNIFDNGEDYVNNLKTDWMQSTEPVTLEAGTYDVTFKTVTEHPHEEGNKWYMALRGFKLYKEIASANGSFTIENISYAANASQSYIANVEEAGSYYMSFENSSHNSIAVEVNGESVSRYNAANTNAANPYSTTILNEVYLNEGENIIKFFAARSNDISVDSVTFTKLNSEQYTVTAQSHIGAGAAVETTVSGGNPWYDFKSTATETAASTTFSLDVKTDGYYIPAAIVNGSNDIKLTIDNKTFDIAGSTSSYEGTYYAGGTSAAPCDVKKAESGLDLTAGTYTVKLELTNPGDAEKWATCIAGARLYKLREVGSEFAFSNVEFAAGTSKTYEVKVEEAGSYYMSFINANPNNIAVEVNGEKVSRYNATNTVYGGNPYSATILDEVYFKEGINTIKVFSARDAAITADSVTFTKLDNEQYTVTAQSYIGAGAAVETTVAGGTPWYDFKSTATDTAASTTFSLDIKTDGYYIPAAIVNGSNDIKLTINNKTFDIAGSVASSEGTYIAGATNGAAAHVKKAESGLDLTAGTYSVKLELTNPGDAEKWATYIAGARLYKAIKPTDPSVTIQGGDDFTVYGAKTGASTYTVNVTEDTSYYVTLEDVSTANFYIEVNGERINRYTGGILTVSEYPRTYKFHNEILLKTGDNTVVIGERDGNAFADVTAIFEKADRVQHTFSYLTYTGADIEGTYGVWKDYLQAAVTENAPTLAFTVNVPKAGWYNPAVAYHSVSDGEVKVTINNVTDELTDDNRINEQFIGGCNNGATCYWYVSDEAVYLEASTNYTFTTELYGMTEGKWNMGVSAVRLYETTAPAVELQVTSATVAEGVVTVNYTAPTSESFILIAASYTLENGVKRLNAVSAPVSVTGENKADYKTLTVGGSGDVYEVFVWDNLTNMKPLLTSITAN